MELFLDTYFLHVYLFFPLATDQMVNRIPSDEKEAEGNEIRQKPKQKKFSSLPFVYIFCCRGTESDQIRRTTEMKETTKQSNKELKKHIFVVPP
ncbi:hypothetical protein CEXT_494851 [Caerostris extrusa]|uniref:Uncharacterized protein n=1 Tax=Caerostris extrusa TaxID=172846 RepID=A0AAV4NZS2_CAEEX|nr:hypothetical protein CEXT_494851 [Caerostris extrusa]